MIQTLQQIDTQALIALRSLALPYPELAKWFVKIFSDIEIFLGALFMITLWLRGSFSKQDSFKIEALRIFFVIAGAFLVYMLLNLGLPMRARPETVTAIAPMIAHLPDNSFPSGHAIFASASVVALFAFLDKKCIGLSFAILGLIMCLARVVAGVHYPGDILAGFLVGSIFAFIFVAMVKKIPEKHPLFQIPIKIAAWIKL